ncbi:MAG: hypothetical protein HY261_04095 [Chloroflexi bacterium]|nr:hypothetical protein [Chloroflexota bacterium]
MSLPLHLSKAIASASIASALVFAACGGGSTPTAPTPVPSASTTPCAASGTQQVNVQTESFKFTPKDFNFKCGSSVTFALVSKDIGHNFTANDLGIAWDIGSKASMQTFTFTRSGTFRLVCTIAGHEAAGMVGKITITP